MSRVIGHLDWCECDECTSDVDYSNSTLSKLWAVQGSNTKVGEKMKRKLNSHECIVSGGKRDNTTCDVCGKLVAKNKTYGFNFSEEILLVCPVCMREIESVSK